MNRDFHLNACVGYNGGPPSFGRLAKGYYEAALIISDKVIVEKSGMDYLIYPALELYRHGFELMSKATAESLESINKVNLLTTNHNVCLLWDKMMPELDKIEIMPNNLRNAIKNSLNTFRKLNPNAQMFRYPTDKSGTLISMGSERIINFPDLREEIQSSYNAIDQVSGYISSLASSIDDYR